MTGHRITVDRYGRRTRGRVGLPREEGFLFALLLQSVLCAVMLAFAFALGQLYGMTEVKTCFRSMLSQETEAVEVFSAFRRVGETKPARRLADLLQKQIDAMGAALPRGQGGELAVIGSALPSGVTSARPILSAPMLPPLSGELTDTFGARTHPISGKADFHTGVDLSAPRGTSIAVAYPGQVAEVGQSKIYGNYVLLFHGGFYTRYCHCDSIAVSQGMKLRRGETIATVGSTGVSTGPHLHFELIIDGKNADPFCGQQIAWGAA